MDLFLYSTKSCQWRETGNLNFQTVISCLNCESSIKGTSNEENDIQEFKD